MKLRIVAIAVLTLLIQGAFACIGFLVGLAVVGLYLGYMRAWEISTPAPLAVLVEDDD